MNGGHAAGGEKVAGVHKTRDREPAIDTGGTREMRAGGTALKKADEEIELHAEKNVEQNEDKLNDETRAL